MGVLRDIGLWLFKLLPANPILVRVVSTGGKRQRHLWARLIYLVALMAVFLLGGVTTVETVDGRADLSVPPGTRPGTVFKLRGQGIPFLRSRGRGDHLVTLHADMPKKLTREQKKLVDELKGLGL